MKAKEYVSKLVLIFAGALLLMSCLLPGMIPLTSVPKKPLPVMEKDADKLIEALNGKNWVYLQALATEQYTEADYAKPGTLAYTVKITDNKPTYFSYGWCTKDDATLKQNFQHISVGMYLDGDKLGTDVVHNLSLTLADGKTCLDFGVLLSDWPAGKYQLKAVATFAEKINDGFADFDAGDYIFEYNVTVEK